MKQLLDFSYARPGAKAIKKAGYVGVLRYLSYTPGKNLSAAEIAEYHADGLGIGVVWETTDNRVLSGHAGGKADASESVSQLNKLGMPIIPIYFAVDFAASEAQMATIDDYLAGCAEAIGKEWVGVYGSFSVIEHCATYQSAKWFWQTMAWSKGKVSKHNHIIQDLADPGIPSTDHNIAPVNDWGGWYPEPEKPIEQAIVPTPETPGIPVIAPDAPQAPASVPTPER